MDVNPIALSNAFTFIKNMPDDGLVVILDIGAVSSTLVVYGKGQQYFTRDLPLGGHHFVKELSDKKEISYTEAQDLLFKEGLSAAVSNAFMEPSDRVGIAERTVYDNLVEDLRRSLRFYAKQTGQSFFLKVFLSGGAADTAGLTDFISSKLNIECGIFDPFFEVEGAENISVNNPSQFTTALGLGIRGGMAHD